MTGKKKKKQAVDAERYILVHERYPTTANVNISVPIHVSYLQIIKEQNLDNFSPSERIRILEALETKKKTSKKQKENTRDSPKNWLTVSTFISRDPDPITTV